MQQKVNNRYREYTIAIPSQEAESIKAQAREMKISEQEWIKRTIAHALATSVVDAIATSE